MITFSICLALLVTAYFTYGRYLERLVAIDDAAPTPCRRLYDGVDYVPLPRWRVFLIQLLNIAGTGPIFGAVLGACFGPVAFLWITLGGIFMGAMHDFLSGVLLVRHDGLSIPEAVGHCLGGGMRRFMRLFSVLLLVLVGAVFLLSPAQLLGNMTPAIPAATWVWIILAYYFIATLLPIDKLIGNLYPIFGLALLFMAAGLFAILVFGGHDIPTGFADGLASRQSDGAHPIFPMMFVSIACGAISGFHATQSPMMARCLKNERLARPIFYGAMVAEGLVALIWAAAAIAFTGGYPHLQAYMADHGANAGELVNEISMTWLGTFGGILALLGVVMAPITTGDTALRSSRLIVADFLHIDQKKIIKRLLVSLPIFVLCFLVMCIDFNVLWRYFAWCNQTLAVFTLWAITVWLARHGKAYIVTLLPAMFMTAVSVSYLLFARRPEGFGLPWGLATGIGCAVAVGLLILFAAKKKKIIKH